MKKRSTFLYVVLVSFVLSVTAFAAAPKMQVLHSFSGGTDGSSPVANLVSDAAGNLYGATPNGGINNIYCEGAMGCGVVFELMPPKSPGGAWKETILYRFSGGSDGGEPMAGLIFDQSGNLYGTTSEGGDLNNPDCTSGTANIGCGVVFELSPQQDGGWIETAIYTFAGATDGADPVANLVFDNLGNLYGTARIGGGTENCISGPLLGCGTVFELSPTGSSAWIETTLYQFQGTFDGAFPTAGLVFDQLGNLYGTTTLGSPFELTPGGQGQQWSISSLYPISAHSGLIFDAQGNLYGAASDGNGSVFELSPSDHGTWTESTLYNFVGQTSAPLAAPVFDDLGNLYGTLSGKYCGAVYRLENKNNGWTEAQLNFFKETTNPCIPESSLIFGKWGAVYGTSFKGGTCKGRDACGTVFGILP